MTDTPEITDQPPTTIPAPRSMSGALGIKPLSNHDVVAAVTLPDGQIPGTFPAMLDDALSSVSLKQGGQQGVTDAGV
jgi:hypothetical protein